MRPASRGRRLGVVAELNPVARRTRSAAAASAIGAAAALWLTGCGGPSSNGEQNRSADQILKDAGAALQKASSVHLVGTAHSAQGSFQVDLRMSQKGESSGSISSGGQRFEVVIVGGRTYLRSAQLAQRIGAATDRYILLPVSGQGAAIAQDVAGFATLKGFAGSGFSSQGTPVKTGTTSIDGQPAVGVKDSSGGTLYVATTGSPYPLELTQSGDTVRFTEYGSGFRVTPPPNPIDFPAG